MHVGGVELLAVVDGVVAADALPGQPVNQFALEGHVPRQPQRSLAVAMASKTTANPWSTTPTYTTEPVTAETVNEHLRARLLAAKKPGVQAMVFRPSTFRSVG